jgi:hypothetical protein
VQGTDVYSTGGEKLGDIYDVMLDKRSGRIAYPIMSFGGILGIGKQYHPLPWQTLKYDTRQEGYVVGLTKEALEGGPAFGTDDKPAWGNRAYEQGIRGICSQSSSRSKTVMMPSSPSQAICSFSLSVVNRTIRSTGVR